MKKLLLLMMAVILSVNISRASDPVFPESFDVEIDVEGLEVSQAVQQGVYTITVEGECDQEQFSLTIQVPEGWDGFVGMTDLDFNPDIDPYKSRAAEAEWVPVEALLESGMKSGNVFTFPVDNDVHFGQLYLYKGELADEANAIALEIYVEKKAVAEPDPVFPETFDVEVDVEGLEVSQAIQQEVYTITVEGECDQEQFSLTIQVPEGWDGFIGMTDLDYNPDIDPYKSRAFEAEWVPVDMLLEVGMKKGNVFTFPVDNDAHFAQLYLYKGDMADEANQVSVEIYVEKKAVAEPDPVFPESFDVTADSEKVEISQGIDEETNQYLIMVEGTTSDDNVTLTFDLPEGWDGLIGGIMDFGGMIVKSRSESWPSIEDYSAELASYGIEDVMQGTQFVFPADGVKTALFCLYAGDKVDVEHGIMMVVNVVNSGQSGIESIEADNADARYYNLHGVEVANPENGIFVKIANGRASKIIVK